MGNYLSNVNSSSPESLAGRLDPGAFALVLSGPPGAGKTSVGQALLERDSEIRPCITSTTRPMRPGEVDGVDYHFLSEAVFREKVAQGGFVEWAEVYGALYGATVEAVSQALSGGGAMLLVVDVQGVAAWKQALKSHCVSVFLVPPSIEELERRLAGRSTEEGEVLQRRIGNIRKELSQAYLFDYLVINDHLEQAILKVQNLVQAERSRPWRMPGVLVDLGAGTPSSPI
ncbi:MAG: guanylate kinase [bacterium]|nr:guanylate kinase [bacterium]